MFTPGRPILRGISEGGLLSYLIRSDNRRFSMAQGSGRISYFEMVGFVHFTAHWRHRV